MLKTYKEIRTALQCVYLILTICGAAKMYYNLDRLTKPANKRARKEKKRDRRKEIVIDFID